jgi:hypothetical protein
MEPKPAEFVPRAFLLAFPFRLSCARRDADVSPQLFPLAAYTPARASLLYWGSTLVPSFF